MSGAEDRFVVRIERMGALAFRAMQLGARPAPPRGIAVANALAASLATCLHEARIGAAVRTADVAVEMARAEDAPNVVQKVVVTLHVKPPVDALTLGGCVERFEQLCVGTRAGSGGYEVTVRLAPRA